MFWTTRVNKIAGVTLLLLALGIILSVATSLPITDADPLERGEVEDLLVDIQDNQELFGLNHAIEIIIDSVVGIAAAGVLYLVFRSRNRTLALFGFAFLLAGQVAFVASDAGSLTLLFLADDFSLGGAGGLAPGDAAVVEVARAVAISSGLADQMGFTSLSVGLIAVGLLISWAPAGAGPVPPRWLGWLAARGWSSRSPG
ncbi:MAG: hypothetical protein A2148_07360 [Chloroflexi bacterium RBG_16_68_14]|nr:MAG: hypothetical protein A2148_07360 [Chloroflexi bacterium RBG_16_68_14]